MKEKNKREIGSLQEERAVQYLQEQGYTILERNYWTTFSEIDIVAKEDNYLCFVEVKYRKDTRYGAPEGLLTREKMRRICKAGQYYLRENSKNADISIRYDVIFIIGEEITLIRNAFHYIG